MRIVPLLIVLLFSQLALSDEECTLTEEYSEARKEAYFQAKEIHDSYNQCQDSMRSAYYWKAVAACQQEGLGQDVGGGCAHLVGRGSYPSEKTDISHCEIFVVPKEIEEQYREELVSRISVQKCET